MTFNPSGLFEELTSTTQKLAKGYETLKNIEEVTVATTPKELVWKRDKVKLYHYLRDTPAKCKIPVLVSFAMLNRHDVLDLQPDRRQAVPVRHTCAQFRAWRRFQYAPAPDVFGPDAGWDRTIA